MVVLARGIGLPDFEFRALCRLSAQVEHAASHLYDLALGARLVPGQPRQVGIDFRGLPDRVKGAKIGEDGEVEILGERRAGQCCQGRAAGQKLAFADHSPSAERCYVPIFGSEGVNWPLAPAARWLKAVALDHDDFRLTRILR